MSAAAHLQGTPSDRAEHWVKGAPTLGCLHRVAPEPLSLQAGSYYLYPRAGFADGADGVHTEGDILSSEVIAGGVVLCEPDDAHDSVDELDHQNGCKERQVLTKGYRPLSAIRKGPRNLTLASAVWPLTHLTARVHRAESVTAQVNREQVLPSFFRISEFRVRALESDSS